MSSRLSMLVVWLAASVTCGCGSDAHDTATKSVLSVQNFPAISYFQKHCATCHGAYGSDYLPDMNQRLAGEALRDVIEEMTRGPAQAPLDGEPLEALIEFHLAVLDRRPFVSITHLATGELSGEVTPGSTVRIVRGAQVIDARVQDHTWSAANGFDVSDIELIIVLNGSTIRIKPTINRLRN